MKRIIYTACLLMICMTSFAQTATIKGRVTDKEATPISFAKVFIKSLSLSTETNRSGDYMFENIPYGKYAVEVFVVGYKEDKKVIDVSQPNVKHNVSLITTIVDLDEFVVTGTMKEVRKAQSPVPVSVISAKMFCHNPTSNILDALYLVNGVNPQVNCNMCNTSDIGINGMQGAYSMVLIDGMPIVSSLSSVYGISGIPNTIIDRVELVKGPASSLYGSEAIGGVINLITKKSSNAPRLFLDVNGSTWGELTANAGFSSILSDNVSTMFSADGYYYNTPKDQDKDNYMDKTLQQRISLFNKWDFKQAYGKRASISLRYYNENRHGGELEWNKEHRGFVDFTELNDDKQSDDYNGDVALKNGLTIYNEKYAKGFRVPRFENTPEGEAAKDEWFKTVKEANPNAIFADDMKYQESIYTSRFEAVAKYELPIEENITFQGSYNQHDQNSAYGVELFMAHQKTAFGQLYWDKEIANHDLLAGVAYRYVWFNDNTIASENGKKPFVTQLPGIFVQDLWRLSDKTSLLLGYRFDYDITESSNMTHKNAVHSPRLAFKYALNPKNTFRASVGTGYRVVNIFSEDHRALSGQFEARFGENLKPEKSVSGTLDYEGRIATESIGLTYSVGAYYTHFFNKIYYLRDTDARTLTYFNVDGSEYARNIGLSLDLALNFSFPLKLTAGISYNNAQLYEYSRDGETGEKDENSEKVWNDVEFSPRFMGVYSISYNITPKLLVDVTGEWKSPMLLPTQDDEYSKADTDGNLKDPRDERSPFFNKTNLQLTYNLPNNIQIYGGVKNIFNYSPKHLLVNTKDPFNDIADTFAQDDDHRTIQFDTEYNYTPQQGTTGFIGVRYSF